MALNIVFAIPGDMHRRTGGFIYESTVLSELRALGHKVTHLQLPAGFPDPSDAEIAETLALLQAVPPDAVLLLDGFIPGCMGANAMAQITAPVVAIIHHPLGMETGLPPDRAAWLLASEAAALRHMHRIIVPSPHTARLLTRDFHLNPAQIDIAAPGFDPVAGNMQPVDPPLILSVGLLAARKGHDVLIDALGQLRDLDWQARIVGATHDDAVAADLARRIGALDLSGRITLTGPLSQADLDTAYAQASIFALATRFEGYGMVFGDAMLRGLPIVTCATGAVPDTVGDAARLVPADDPRAFADALRGLLVNPAVRRSLADLSARRGRDLPRWRDTAARIAQTLARVVDEDGATPLT